MGYLSAESSPANKDFTTLVHEEGLGDTSWDDESRQGSGLHDIPFISRVFSGQ